MQLRCLSYKMIKVKSYKYLFFFFLFYHCLIAVQVLSPEVVRIISKKNPGFTQGLIFARNEAESQLIESQGLYGQSRVVLQNIKTAKNKKKDLESRLLWEAPKDVFLEGLTEIKGQFYLLTWKKGIQYVFDKNFNLLHQRKYLGEGWGLTSYQGYLLQTDGSEYLSFMEVDKYEFKKKLLVQSYGLPIKQLNELESTGKYILANVWYSEKILVLQVHFNEARVELVALIDCHKIVQQENTKSSKDVLNGIAWDPEDKKLYITGKNWKNYYQIKLYYFDKVGETKEKTKRNFKLY